MSQEIVGRRNFLKGLSGLALSGIGIVGGYQVFNDLRQFDWTRYVRGLLAVYDQWPKKPGRRYVLCEECVEGLDYAFKTIQPVDHVERCTALYCGQLALTATERAIHTTDEYVRRRRGDQPHFPSHPLFMAGLAQFAVPRTHGLMMYRDQWECFMVEITDAGMSKVREMLKRLYQWKLKFDTSEFHDALCPDYRERISSEDLRSFQKVFDRSYGYGSSYSYYSTWISDTDRFMAKKV